ncbi:MAG: hypothetical protein AB1689_25955 [Thermodesulfobacteriota bacterium]
MRKVASFVVVLLAGALAAGLTNCGGSGTGGGPAPRGPQFVLNKAGTSSNSGTLVLGLDRFSIDANNADEVTVVAQLLAPLGDPIGGVRIDFAASFPDVTFEGSPPPLEGELPTGFSVTDGNGFAPITARAGGTPGRLAIQATAPPNFHLGGVIFLQLEDVGFISGDLQVLPQEITVIDPAPGTVIEFLVIGGQPFLDPDPPYLLQNEASSLGIAELLDDGLFPVVIRYTLTGRGGGALMGTHAFSIVDAAGNAVTATVNVEFTELTIMPDSVTLVTGQSQVFALTGGVPPYTCTPSGGTLTPTTILNSGGTTTFTAGDVLTSTTFTIVCNDQSGQIVTAEVTVGPAPSPSGGGGTPVPSATPQTASTVVVRAVPPTVNGIDGGTANVTATVFDQNLNPIAGLNVVFTIEGQPEEPPANVPTLSNLTAVTDGNGQAATVLNVPGGTPPQFLTINAQTVGASGQGVVPITSQRTEQPGPPARVTAALIKANAFGDNNDGTFVTVIAALVTDANGNPVNDGIQVDWGPVQPNTATIASPSFTNGLPPCNIEPYERDTSIDISPQPGTAITCLIYPSSLAFGSGSVQARVNGTSIMTNVAFTFPGPEVQPTPPPPPPTQTPAPTPTPGPPVVVPSNASLAVGGVQVFAVTGGVAPYMVNASGGTAMPTTIPSAGGTFTYTKTSPGSFTIVVVDSRGAVGTAMVMDLPTPVPPTPTP